MPNNERLLAPVPATTYAVPNVNGSQPWSANYNVACWLRGRAAQPQDLSLVVRFRDQGGERQVTVDRGRVGKDAGVLMSACVEIAARGKIAEMTVWVVSAVDGCDVLVDELYVQRVGDKAVQPLVLASR